MNVSVGNMLRCAKQIKKKIIKLVVCSRARARARARSPAQHTTQNERHAANNRRGFGPAEEGGEEEAERNCCVEEQEEIEENENRVGVLEESTGENGYEDGDHPVEGPKVENPGGCVRNRGEGHHLHSFFDF